MLAAWARVGPFGALRLLPDLPPARQAPGDYSRLGTIRFLSMSKELPSGCTVTTLPSSWWT